LDKRDKNSSNSAKQKYLPEIIVAHKNYPIIRQQDRRRAARSAQNERKTNGSFAGRLLDSRICTYRKGDRRI
jgi:hypothetical protein